MEHIGYIVPDKHVKQAMKTCFCFLAPPSHSLFWTSGSGVWRILEAGALTHLSLACRANATCTPKYPRCTHMSINYHHILHDLPTVSSSKHSHTSLYVYCLCTFYTHIMSCTVHTYTPDMPSHTSLLQPIHKLRISVSKFLGNSQWT